MSQRPSRCRLVAISQGPHGEHVRAKEQSLEKWTVPPNTFTENDPKVINHPFSCCLRYLPDSINIVHVFSTDFILLYTPFLLLFPFPILFCIHPSYTHSPRNTYFKAFMTQPYHSKALLKKQSVFTHMRVCAVCVLCYACDAHGAYVVVSVYVCGVMGTFVCIHRWYVYLCFCVYGISVVCMFVWCVCVCLYVCGVHLYVCTCMCGVNVCVSVRVCVVSGCVYIRIHGV